MMRRLLPLGLLLLLPACNYASSPVDGAGSFLKDTVNFHTNPNAPVGDTPNMRRAAGVDAATTPLLPEAGNVWPGPLPPSKTLADLQKDVDKPIGGDDVDAPPPVAPRAITIPRSDTVAPGPLQTVSPAPLPVPGVPANQPMGGGAVQSRVFQTPGGPATATRGANGIETYVAPNGTTGTVINNGNGTSTLLGPNGNQTVLTPR